MTDKKKPEATTPFDQPPVTAGDKAPEPKHPSIFDRHRIKMNLTNRIMRALKDATDDEMRKSILAEVSGMKDMMNQS